MAPELRPSVKRLAWKSLKQHVDHYSGTTHSSTEDQQPDPKLLRVSLGPISIKKLQHEPVPSRKSSIFPEDLPLRSSWRQGSRGEVEGKSIFPEDLPLRSSWRGSRGEVEATSYFPMAVKPTPHKPQQPVKDISKPILPSITQPTSVDDALASKLRQSQRLQLAPLQPLQPLQPLKKSTYPPSSSSFKTRRGSVNSIALGSLKRRSSISSISGSSRRRSSVSSDNDVPAVPTDLWPLSHKNCTKTILNYLGDVAIITVNNLDLYNDIFKLDENVNDNMISPTEFARNARSLNLDEAVRDYEICYVMYVFNLCDEDGYNNIPRDYRLYGIADLLHHIANAQRYSLEWAIGDLVKGAYDPEYQAAVNIFKTSYEESDPSRVGQIQRPTIAAAIKKNPNIPKAKRKIINRAIKAACGDMVHLKEYLAAIPIFVKILTENVDWDA